MDTSIVDEGSSPSSSSCFSNDEMYDVFLSFSSADTRKTFTDHLYWTLKDARVDVLMAENKLRGPELMQAIEQSRIAVIIFSGGYAFSIGCLGELEKIMECRRTLGQMVLPIFYHVDPKDVGKQIDSFPVPYHGVKDQEEMRRSWRKSLIEAANLSGLVYTKSDGYEGMFIRKIVDEITRKLKSTCVDVATEQVELDSSKQEISNDLKVQVGKDSRLQEISTRLDVGCAKDAHIQLQRRRPSALKGPRPSALKVNKESVKTEKRATHGRRPWVIQGNCLSAARSEVFPAGSSSKSQFPVDVVEFHVSNLPPERNQDIVSQLGGEHEGSYISSLESHHDDALMPPPTGAGQGQKLSSSTDCLPAESESQVIRAVGSSKSQFPVDVVESHVSNLPHELNQDIQKVSQQEGEHEGSQISSLESQHDDALMPSPTGAGQGQKLSSSTDCLPAGSESEVIQAVGSSKSQFPVDVVESHVSNLPHEINQDIQKVSQQGGEREGSEISSLDSEQLECLLKFFR